MRLMSVPFQRSRNIAWLGEWYLSRLTGHGERYQNKRIEDAKQGNGTMLLKIKEFDDALAEHLKRVTGEATASKAVLIAAQEYSGLLYRIEQGEQAFQLAAQEVARLSSIVEGARASAALLLEKTSQSDLFSNRQKDD